MIGRKLNNRYLIEKLVGEGATATVYSAVDVRLRRTVAVKVLLPHVHSTTRQRFEREALAAAKLNHPGIMAVYDVGNDEDTYYIVVELVTGRPLYDLIPSPSETVAEIAHKICLALDYAHRAGLIHRDIKPANIYLTDEGNIKIMDFGLAIPIDGDQKRLTAQGSIIGTPAYLSPEQAQGKPLDPRTDLYSLGIVMYEMVTGVLPFDADDIASILLQQVNKAPVPPSNYVPDMPRWIEGVILRALEKDPDARYQTAAQMVAALANRGGHDSEDPKATLSPKAAEPEQPRIRVVLADDHAALRAPLAAYLELAGDIEVVGEAGDGQEAIDQTKQFEPDVLMLDLNMPNVSGLEALPVVRRECPSTRVLVLTGRDETPFIMKALRAGANGYILKTATEAQLVNAVRDVYSGGMVLGEGVAERIVEGLRANTQDPLNEQEHDVLRCIASGIEENDQIAETLKIDETQVVRLLKNAIDKLGVKSRSDAALMALRAGWITLDDLRHDY